MPLRVFMGDKLQILVENQGRVGYGPDIKDFKGLVSGVTLAGRTLATW
jgi:beta-galactosidase